MTYKQIKQIGAFAFALTAMVAYVFSSRNQEPEVLVSQELASTVEIVLLDSDQQCVPFSMPTETTDLNAQLNEIVLSMQSGNSPVQYFDGLFPKGTVLNSAVKEGNLLKLDFNKALLELNPALEIKLLEAMCYVFTQFEGIDQFEFTVEQQPVSQFSSEQFTIQQPLDGSLTLNNFEAIHSMLHRSSGFVVAVRKEVQDVVYYTLKAIRSTDSLIEGLENYYTRTESILVDDHIKYHDFKIQLNDKVLTLQISSEILTPQKSCDPSLIRPILLTLQSNFDIKEIRVEVEGVLVLSVMTEDLYFNQIELLPNA